jgi:uncharacterized membrane protein
MVKLATAYASTALTFMVLDAIWLSTMGALLYRPILGPILAENVRIAPAIIFYVLFVAGIIFFGVLPALGAGRWTIALLNGAIFGFLAYATYDLTNHATLSVWDLRITLADIAWGAFASGAASTVGYFVTDWIVGRS